MDGEREDVGLELLLNVVPPAGFLAFKDPLDVTQGGVTFPSCITQSVMLARKVRYDARLTKAASGML